jgi:hypothetical protein
MGKFHEQNFKQRFAAMGDAAEAVYEAVHPLGKTVRYGWRRPGISMQKMSTVIRHAPDYYAEAGYWVEVMGCGRDGILKSLKVDKWEALKKWKQFARVAGVDLVLFVWNSHREEYVVLAWDEIKKLITKAKRKGIEEFHDGNKYYPIDWEWIVEVASFVGTWSE